MSKFFIDCELNYKIKRPTDLIFQIEVSEHPWQTLVHENLELSSENKWQAFDRDQGLNRLVRAHLGEQELKLRYTAEVDVQIPTRNTQLKECRIAELPSEALFYLAPSRFCESDLIIPMVNNTFGHLAPGYQRVQAICDWIHENIIYQSGSSDSTTSARDILVNRAGVCRDFAHLGVAICRALSIPARFVFGYMPFYVKNPDFHAIFEVYLENQWILFDATHLGPIDQFVRVGTGLDAKDVPFATFYGDVELTYMYPGIKKAQETENLSA